jgi:peptidoglycan/LPS O-acetylase OafA/YrhL
MQKMENKIYFKNLNSLRFMAALIVLLSHVDGLVNTFGVSEKFGEHFSFPVSAEIGVILFFALSGFLITWLLLAEQRLANTINVKSFYIRRALRIWPLYFLTILLAIFVFPFIDFLVFKGYDAAVIWSKLSWKLFFYCIFMPNIVMDFLGFIPYATHSWTIGAEEQFYFLWPLLFKKIKNKMMIFVFVLTIYLGVYYLLRYFPGETKYSKIGFLVWSRYPISCMAIGGMYAYLVFVKNAAAEKIKKILFNVWVQLMMLALLVLLASTGYYFKFFNNEIYAILLGYQVCNLAINPKPIFSLENKLFNYLGKISYGLYMFHPLAIVCAIKLCLLLSYAHNILLYPLALAIAIMLSAFSYRFFEKYFIAKKTKYSTIISGDNVK